MAGVELLIPGPYVGTKSRDIRSGSLEVIEGLKIRVISEVVVEAEILSLVDVMVEAERKLILSVGADGYSLISNAVRSIRSWHEAQQIDRDRIHAGSWDS